MKVLRSLFYSLCILMFIGCTPVQHNPNYLPNNLVVDKSIALPSTVPVAVYIPRGHLNLSYHMRNRTTVQVGRALGNAFDTVARKFFTRVQPVDTASTKQFGLLININPKWSIEDGALTLTAHYSVYNSQLEKLQEGTISHGLEPDYQDPAASYHNASVRVAQKLYVKIINTIKPSTNSMPGLASMNTIPRQLLVSMDKPVYRSTAFKISPDGHLLMRYGALDHCLITKAKIDDRDIDVSEVSSSSLLGISVLDTQQGFSKFVRFEKNADGLKLGEQIVNVSFPWKVDKPALPVLAMGNISAVGGIQGSKGVFQFSSAIKPESKGGMLINAKGNLIGIDAGFYNELNLSESGVLSKNVYFGLKVKYVQQFLDLNNIPYQLSDTANSQEATEIALANTVTIDCYQ